MKFEIDPAELRPLIEAIVDETLAKIQGGNPTNGNHRVAYTERDAAARLGLPQHSLRAARVRGKVTANKIGSRWIYTADEIQRFAREGDGNS